jgi:hypothetical protein
MPAKGVPQDRVIQSKVARIRATRGRAGRSRTAGSRTGQGRNARWRIVPGRRLVPGGAGLGALRARTTGTTARDGVMVGARCAAGGSFT